MKHLLLIITLSLALSACQPAPPPEPTATETPARTATASSTPSVTPSPTQDRPATQTAVANARATEAMEYLEEFVLGDLEMLGYSVDDGVLSFQQDTPISVVASLPGYRYYDFLDFPNPVFTDFVLSVDVTWNSETGLAGCGIYVRGEQDFGDGEYVAFRAIRLSGLPAWDMRIIKFNQIQGTLTRGSSAAINLSAGSTNHYVLVVEGANLTVYANGERLGVGSMRQDITEGRIGFEAYQESGITNCTFTNAWVWELPSSEE